MIEELEDFWTVKVEETKDRCPECGAILEYGNCECGYSVLPEDLPANEIDDHELWP